MLFFGFEGSANRRPLFVFTLPRRRAEARFQTLLLALGSILLLSGSFCVATPARAQEPTATPSADCCSPHADVGCEVARCQFCVCVRDPLCCTDFWDLNCVLQTEVECALECPCAPPATSTPGGDCCAPHLGPGCNDPACQACVCGIDPICCEMLWDADCVAQAAVNCPEVCPCEPTPTPTPTPGGDCCAAHSGPGCDDSTCQPCVCGRDPVCCNSLWDLTCVFIASVECRPPCVCEPPPPTPTPTPGGDCCAEHGGPGCDDPACQTCVCDIDAVCCEMVWDGRCADEAKVECVSSCPCRSPVPCVGDCNRDGQVTVDELITGVNIALSNATLSVCPQFDPGGDGQVTVDELIQAVNVALNGCAGT